MKMSGIMKYEQFKRLADMVHNRHICAAFHYEGFNFHPVRIENATCIKKSNFVNDSIYVVEVAISDFDNSLDDNGLYYYKTSVYETIEYFLNNQLICATCGEQINHLLADGYIKKSGNREFYLKRLCEKCLTVCGSCGEQVPSINYHNVFSDYIEGGNLLACDACKK